MAGPGHARLGAPVSLAYAVQHPEGVGRLMLYGGFANGHHVASAKVRAAMIELVRAHWGLGSDVLADIFLPDGTAETKVRFAELQRRSTTAEVASELLAQCYEIRVDDLLDRVAAPTLVLHRREAAEEDDDEPAPEPSPGIHLERDDRTR